MQFHLQASLILPLLDPPHSWAAAPAGGCPLLPGLRWNVQREGARGGYLQLEMEIHLRGTCSSVNSFTRPLPEELEQVALVCLRSKHFALTCS